MPDSNNGRDSASRAESKSLDSAIFAQQKSNQKSRVEHPVVSVVGVGGG
ncbi:hypothetical protein [uncultured Helicobacter sp.]